MFNDVENFTLKAIHKASTHQQTCIIVGAKMTIARLMIMQGRLSEVEAILTELVALQKLHRDVANLDVIDNAIGYLNAILARDSDIPEWIKHTDTILTELYIRVRLSVCNLWKSLLRRRIFEI